MRRAEVLEAQVGELEGELRALLDEYVEVQQRLQTLESVAGCDGERAAETVLADLPGRLQRVASATESSRPETDDAAREAATGCASQAEVAAAVERVEESSEEETTPDADADDEDLDDIIIG
jgi:hypothetical protein